MAATRLLLCYADDTEDLARTLDLRIAETGANFALANPFDPVVYERPLKRERITIAAPSQVAVDLFLRRGYRA